MTANTFRAEERWLSIFLNGAYGAGKSTVLDHLGDEMASRDLPFALFDVDWFHRSWPTADFDADNTEIEAQNMAAVYRNYLQAGPRHVFVAGVIASQTDRSRYEAVFNGPLTVVHLTASESALRRRLEARYPDRRDALDWHQRNLGAVIDSTGKDDLNDMQLPTDGLSSKEIAAEIMRAYFHH